MIPGDLVQSVFPTDLEMYEGMRDGEVPRKSGGTLYRDEFGLILESCVGIGNHTFHRIITPQNHIGWIYEAHMKVLE